MFGIIIFISCTTNNANKNLPNQKSSQYNSIDNIHLKPTADTMYQPLIRIKYKRPINGYNVIVEWLGADIIDDKLAYGNVLIHFKKNDAKGFTVHNPSYWDKGLNISDIKVRRNNTIELDYIPKNDKHLATESPFYFADMDFDEQDELVVVGWKAGRHYAHTYDVYDISDYYADKKTEPPFDNIELGITKFDLNKKQIIHCYENLFKAEHYVYEKVKTPSPESAISSDDKFILQEVIEKDFISNQDSSILVKQSHEYVAALPMIYIEYKQLINGYKVDLLWLPDCSVGEVAETGQAIIHFTNLDRRDFYIYCDSYSDNYLYGNDYKVQNNDKLIIDYISKDHEYLATKSPFYFSDMDFDGEDELVITNWGAGIKGGHKYEVYDIDDLGVRRKAQPPFDNIEQYFTIFKPNKKTIINYTANIYSEERLYYVLQNYDFISDGEIETIMDFALERYEKISDNLDTLVYDVVDNRFIKR